MTVTGVFLDSEPVKIWWRSSSLSKLRCRVCGHKLKVEKKHVAEALKDYLPEIQYWVDRYERLQKLKNDFRSGKIKSIKQFISALKKALNFPRNLSTPVESASCFFTIQCPRCGQPYNFRVDFRLNPEVFKSTEAFFSWYEVFKLPIGDEKIEWRFQRRFGKPWPQYQEEMYEKIKEEDFTLLVDAAAFFRKEFKLAVDLAKQRAADQRFLYSIVFPARGG